MEKPPSPFESPDREAEALKEEAAQASTERLRRIWKTASDAMRHALGQRHRDALRWRDVRIACALNPNAPLDLILEALKAGHVEAAANPALPLHFLEIASDVELYRVLVAARALDVFVSASDDPGLLEAMWRIASAEKPVPKAVAYALENSRMPESCLSEAREAIDGATALDGRGLRYVEGIASRPDTAREERLSLLERAKTAPSGGGEVGYWMFHRGKEALREPGVLESATACVVSGLVDGDDLLSWRATREYLKAMMRIEQGAVRSDGPAASVSEFRARLASSASALEEGRLAFRRRILEELSTMLQEPWCREHWGISAYPATHPDEIVLLQAPPGGEDDDVYDEYRHVVGMDHWKRLVARLKSAATDANPDIRAVIQRAVSGR